LIAVLLGISFLFIYMLFAPIKPINSQEELSKLVENQKVSVSGNVIAERISQYSKTLVLDNNISLICNCLKTPNLKGKSIHAEGFVDTYQKTQVKVIKIGW